MPSLRNAAARAMSSVQRELPPSTIVSPFSSTLASASTVFCVGSPAGTMIHTIRGASSFLTSSRKELASAAPTFAAFLTAFSSKSKATTS
jgi:hypothetical protein